MKKFFLTSTAVLLTGIFFSVNAGNGGSDKDTRKQQRKERREERYEEWLHSPNVMTEDQFNYDFPAARDVYWTNNAFEEANFMDGTTQKTAYYDNDHELVGTTTNVDYSALPAKSKEAISKKYPGYTINNVILFDDNEVNDTDMFLFGNSFKDEDSFFPLLSKGTKQIMLKVTTNGQVSFFREYK